MLLSCHTAVPQKCTAAFTSQVQAADGRTFTRWAKVSLAL
jgi:hypothetical protein